MMHNHRRRMLIPYALKRRLFIVIMLTTVIPLLLIGSISYYSIFYILQNKVDKGVRSNLEQQVSQMESILDNLDYASRQLAFEGAIGEKLRNFLSSDNSVEKVFLLKDIRKYMTLINYTNPDLGIMEFFLEADKSFIYSQMSYKSEKLDISQYPQLSERTGIVFYGPHESIYLNSKDLVFSAVRRVGDFGLEKEISVYIETNYALFNEQMNNSSYGMKVKHVLLDRQSKVIYSGDPDRFPLGSELTVESRASAVYRNDQFLFTAASDQGWKLVAVIEPGSYSREVTTWLWRFLLFALISLLVSGVLGWLIWRTIYRPIRRLKQEIQQMGKNAAGKSIRPIGILEFDDLLYKFESMKDRITELLAEVESKERNKRILEVEKLMYQINPHFIHNTLNTAQWLAMMNGQDEIVKLLATFSRLLNYNLGKEGGIVTVREEIEALQDYVMLQQMRYNYKFKVEYDLDESCLDCRIPRFILQPLVENSLYHGFKHNDGIIRVITKQTGGLLEIFVEDNGSGMTPEELRSLFADSTDRKKKTGFGIGLNFVNNIVKVNYGEAFKMEVISEPGKGTSMILRFPILPKEDRL